MPSAKAENLGHRGPGSPAGTKQHVVTCRELPPHTHPATGCSVLSSVLTAESLCQSYQELSSLWGQNGRLGYTAAWHRADNRKWLEKASRVTGVWGEAVQLDSKPGMAGGGQDIQTRPGRGVHLSPGCIIAGSHWWALGRFLLQQVDARS